MKTVSLEVIEGNDRFIIINVDSKDSPSHWVFFIDSFDMVVRRIPNILVNSIQKNQQHHIVVELEGNNE